MCWTKVWEEKKGNLFTDFSFIYDFLQTPTFGMLMKRQDCKTTL